MFLVRGNDIYCDKCGNYLGKSIYHENPGMRIVCSACLEAEGIKSFCIYPNGMYVHNVQDDKYKDIYYKYCDLNNCHRTRCKSMVYSSETALSEAQTSFCTECNSDFKISIQELRSCIFDREKPREICYQCEKFFENAMKPRTCKCGKQFSFTKEECRQYRSEGKPFPNTCPDCIKKDARRLSRRIERMNPRVRMISFILIIFIFTLSLECMLAYFSAKSFHWKYCRMRYALHSAMLEIGGNVSKDAVEIEVANTTASLKNKQSKGGSVSSSYYAQMDEWSRQALEQDAIERINEIEREERDWQNAQNNVPW